MPTTCDISDCKNRSAGTYEDMSDGEWIELCKGHIRKFRKSGQLFGMRVDLR